MSYSIDLRKRCVKYYTSGHTKKETSRAFQVGTATVSRWRAEFRDNGLWKNTYKIDSRIPSKLKHEELKIYVDEHPDAFLREIVLVFGASKEGVRNALK
jgi:transposase